MTRKERKQYPAEYKREAVRLVMEQGYKLSEAARNLGIHGGMLGRWVRQTKEGSKGVISGKGSSPEQEELHRLRSENKRLLMEREILKKAAAFFAKESS